MMKNWESLLWGFVFGVALARIPGVVRGLLANRALRKRLGLVMKPEYMETRQMRRQYGRGFAKGAVKLAKEMQRQTKLSFRERFRLWIRHRLPTFLKLSLRIRSLSVGLYSRLTRSKASA